MFMKTLNYYFRKKSDDPVDTEAAGPSLPSDRRQHTINIVISKRKRPVGRLRKCEASHPKRLAKIVDYSCSQ